MKNWTVLLAVLSLATGECPADWTRFQQTCLALIRQNATWSTAQATCRAEGARLATLQNKTKDMNMEKFIHTIEHFSGVAAWVGGTDVVKESHWVWTDNDLTPFTYTNWNHPPNNLHNNIYNGENCLAIQLGHNKYKWMDNSCEERSLPFICERDVGPSLVFG